MKDVYKRQGTFGSISKMSAPIASASVSATFAVTPDAEKYATSLLLIVFFLINLFISFIQHEV